LRETAMHRAFTNDEFKKFVLADQLMRQYDALSRTLTSWQNAELRASGLAILKYLPAQATIHVKVFPEIKPVHNSFVFDSATDPAIFLYLNPSITEEEFQNTVA